MKKITEENVQNFYRYLYEEEKSEHTIEKYMRELRFFRAWLGDRQMDKAVVIAYKKRLCENHAPKSVNAALSSLNTFFAFMEWYDLKLRLLKIQRRIFSDKAKELTKQDYEKLLTAARKQQNQRLYYLMQTIASTGLRVSEIKYVTVESVNIGQATINCKGKIRQIFLPKKLCKILKEYLQSQQIKSGAVFVSKNGKPLDRSNIWKMLKSLCASAGVSEAKVFPHNFRHLFARTYYSLQKDIVRLADILGHSSVETTRIYTVESGETHILQLQRLGLVHCP